MRRSRNDRLIMAVAQQPFTSDLNQFCKLVPLADLDGNRATPGEFPNDDEIWWMLTAQTAALAEPGNLVVGDIEDATRYSADDPNSSAYQVVRDSVRQVEIGVGLEVLSVPGDAIDRIEDLVSGDRRFPLSHRPTPSAMICWRSQVYGPFKTSYSASTPGQPGGVVSFSPHMTDLTAYHVEEDAFRAAAGQSLLQLSCEVSVTAMRRTESYRTITTEFNLLLTAGYERFLARNPPKMLVESVEQKVNRLARDFLTRKQRRELRVLLEQLEVTGGGVRQSEDAIDAIGRIKLNLTRQDALLDTLAASLLESGLLGEDRLRNAEQAYGRKYVEERAAEIQAQVNEAITSKRDELQKVEAKLRSLGATFQKEQEDQRAELEAQLTAQRKEAETELASERAALEVHREELDRQKQVLQQNLEQVTHELREAGDEVVNRFLAIAPLIRLMDTAPVPSLGEKRHRESAERSASPAFTLPLYVTRHRQPSAVSASEEAFFDRFIQVVQNRGFEYRREDLIRFHLSVKTGVLTVLAGPSGTGKSSLPILYADALAGEELQEGRPGCLMVSVNPSWMDFRDLLGHLNTLEGRFYPAESGLFRRLICAWEEYRKRRSETGIYITCLDEMNLSQVEHYFGDLMMALEREGEQRRIHCFSPDAGGDACPFREWSTLSLSPSLRFVGTVNFDETTRLLSDRFLDRANLIQLRPAVLPSALDTQDGPPASSKGRLITLSDFESWQRNTGLPVDLATLLDSMRPLLQLLGCPVSPRTYRGICRFVGSAEPLLPAARAFDLQVAQRLLPRIRSLISRRQLDAFDELQRLLSGSGACAFDETLPLLKEMQELAAGGSWPSED